MRDSNYKNIAQNKAAVSITTNLYDRRALDVTCDQPLVNSLNHLTFLTSSSAKVRETLATDGGLERLVSILHECRKDPSDEHYRKKSIAEEKQSALIAWKWTLAFQCLVLVGTRGTEEIRKRVVEAGIIPIIATVLDNFLLIVRNFDNESDTNFNQGFLRLVSKHLNKSHDTNGPDNVPNDGDLVLDNVDDNNDTNDEKRPRGTKTDDAEFLKFLNKDSELYKYLEAICCRDNKKDEPIEVTENIVELNLHDSNDKITSPRMFLNGILVPKDDDVVWSLQLLAFISKYSVLKDLLQFTHLVDTLSLRTLIQQTDDMNLDSLGISNELFCPPDNDYDLFSNGSSDDQSRSTQLTQLTQPSSLIHSSSQSHPIEPSTQSTNSQECSDILIQSNSISNENIKNIIPNLHQLPSSDSLSSSESSTASVRRSTTAQDVPAFTSSSCHALQFMKNKTQTISRSLLNTLSKCDHSCRFAKDKGDEKILNMIELNIKLTAFYNKKLECQKRNSMIKSKQKGEEYNAKWNYSTYFCNPKNLLPSADLNKDFIITHPLNIFPLVEKFTIRTLNSPDMHYWSGVIMRNSCRKDEQRGGVRQCASFECGKWESFPREFAKCRRCKRTKYCSKECQLRAWVYHKNWCVDSSTASTSSGHNHGTPARNIDGIDDTGNVTVATTAAESESISRDEIITDQLNETHELNAAL